jgi:hypothetical protein
MKTSSDQQTQTETVPSPALLDFPSAQAYLGGISRSTLKLLVWRGWIVPTRIGKRVMFSRRVLDQYIQHHTATGGESVQT